MAQTQTPTPRKHDAARERRVQDEAYTRIVEGFLDTIYARQVSPYDSSKKFSDHLCRNEYDVEAQKKGGDIFVEGTPQGNLVVDEKFAINYREKDLNTFSFELESKARSGDGWTERPGWFINPENETTHYMLLWFKSDHDISSIYDYEACLVSKQAIKDKLAQDGVDIDKILPKFKEYAESVRGQTGDKITWEYNGYRITQSTQFEEAPINIIIPREKLRELAELQMQKQDKAPIRIQDAIDSMEKEKKVDLSKAVSPKVAELLNTRNLVTGSLYYEREGQSPAQGQFRGTPAQGDKLSVMVDGQLKPIAQFHKGHWFALTTEPVIYSIFKKSVHPLNDMLVQQLQERHGMSITAMDRMHQPLSEIPERNFDGMILKVTNPLTQQIEGRFQYHEAINRFVALDNSPLAEKTQVIDGISIISDTEYMKIRAFADRVADYTREKENRYSGRTQQEAEQYAKRVIAAVTSPDWRQTRSTEMEAIAQGLSKAERAEIIGAMTHDGCINAFAEKLMNREKVCGTADLFISCTQEENYRFPTRNQRINTFDLAREVGCEITERPGYNGRTNIMINWTPETVAAACELIREQNNRPNTQFIFEGYAPTWAMAAFMHECEPNKTFISNKLTGVLDMQGITYGNGEGPVRVDVENVARISTIRCESMAEGIIYPAQIQLPEIEPGQIVFIQGDLPYYAQIAIGEKYGEIAAAVYFEQKNGDFTCGISNHELFTVGDQLSNAKREQVVGQLLQEMAGQEIVGQENGEGQEVEDPDLLPV